MQFWKRTLEKSDDFSGERLLSITPCAYPIPSNIFDCGISDIELLQDIKLCDPDQTISMSEGSFYFNFFFEFLPDFLFK